MMNKIVDKASGIIEKLMLGIFGISIMVLVLITVYSVIMRYIINAPVSWTEEVQMILVVWMSFFCICVTILRDGNIAIDLLVNRFPDKMRTIVMVFDWIIMLAVLVVVMRLGFVRLGNLMNSNQMTAVLHIPKYIQYLAVALSGIVMIISHCLLALQNLCKRKKGE